MDVILRKIFTHDWWIFEMIKRCYWTEFIYWFAYCIKYQIYNRIVVRCDDVITLYIKTCIDTKYTKTVLFWYSLFPRTHQWIIWNRQMSPTSYKIAYNTYNNNRSRDTNSISPYKYRSHKYTVPNSVVTVKSSSPSAAYICVSESDQHDIGSDNSLSPIRRQAII